MYHYSKHYRVVYVFIAEAKRAYFYSYSHNTYIKYGKIHSLYIMGILPQVIYRVQILALILTCWLRSIIAIYTYVNTCMWLLLYYYYYRAGCAAGAWALGTSLLCFFLPIMLCCSAHEFDLKCSRLCSQFVSMVVS